MKLVVAMAALGLVLTQAGSTPAQSQASSDEACQVIAQAIEVTKSLKVGMTRSELEKDFREDGGLTFFGQGKHHGRYLYRKCVYIKIDVELSIGDAGGRPVMSPADRVTKVSRAYLEYPFHD